MFRHFNVEAFVFWWINSVMAIFALLWVAKKIADFLEHRDKLRKKVEFWGAISSRDYLSLLHV